MLCVYVQRGPSPHPPSKRRLLRTKLLSTLSFFKIVNVYSYSLVFCGLIFSFFFLFYVSIVSVVSVVHLGGLFTCECCSLMSVVHL